MDEHDPELDHDRPVPFLHALLLGRVETPPPPYEHRPILSNLPSDFLREEDE